MDKAKKKTSEKGKGKAKSSSKPAASSRKSVKTISPPKPRVKETTQSVQGVNFNEIVEKSSKGHKVGSSGATLAILCFFMPWILASCGGETVQLNGWQLAAGTTIGQGFYAQPMEGRPILFLVLLAAFGIIYLAYAAYKRGSLTPNMDGYGVIGLGVLPLLILLISFSGLEDQAARQGIYVEFQFGVWGVVLGYIAAITGGVLNLRE